MSDEANQTPPVVDRHLVEILREISIQIQNDPVARQRTMKLLAGNSTQDVVRAALWSKATNVPYYKEHFAREIQPYLDKMIVDRKPLEWRFCDFPHFTRRTLFHKIYQSFLWLCDCDENCAKYIELRNQVEISRKYKSGIRILFQRISSPGEFKPLEVDPDEPTDKAIPKWRSRVDEFLSTGEVGTSLHLTRLKLTSEDVEDLHLQLANLSNVIGRVSRDEIKIIKPTEEQMAKIKQPTPSEQ